LPSTPIVISVLSLAIAAFALGWNVYRDVVLKAKLKVTVATMGVFAGSAHAGWFLQLAGVNFGPGVLTVFSITARKSPRWWQWRQKPEYYYVMANNPASQYGDQLPARLELGQQVRVALSTELYDQDWSTIGLQDTFGRTHWVKTASYSQVRRRFLDEHRDTQAPESG